MTPKGFVSYFWVIGLSGILAIGLARHERSGPCLLVVTKVVELYGTAFYLLRNQLRILSVAPRMGNAFGAG